jgi:hypothetical protein
MLLFNCPFCSCVFCSSIDLEAHLACFGRDAILHMRNSIRTHGEMSMSLSHDFGGADRTVRDFEDLIRWYARECRKSNRKVQVLE